MSSDKRFLALRLQGPLQAWGFDSQYNRRNTALMPTRSAIAGICCAALGLPRGGSGERAFLDSFRKLRMTAIALPRRGARGQLAVRRLQDYHTVQNTRRASGAINNDCVVTHRQYLIDAAFGVVLEGDGDLLKNIASALDNPKWGVWLGRKTCIPTAPVLAGLESDHGLAWRLLIGDMPFESFTRQEEADNFADGRDSLPDNPLSFDSGGRSFSLRRVKTTPGKG